MITIKPCVKCGATARNAQGKCIPCRKAYSAMYHKANYQDNREIINARNTAWRTANPEKAKAAIAAWNKANPGRAQARSAAWAKANPDKMKANYNKYRTANPEKCKAAKDKYRAANPENGRAYSASYHASHKEQDKARGAAYNKAYPERINAHCAHRKAMRFQATPGWANLEKIKEFFYTAKMIGMHTGIKHHVDHIVPLNSKLVCGLHCEANLQILEAAHNIRKGNRIWPDMP